MTFDTRHDPPRLRLRDHLFSAISREIARGDLQVGQPIPSESDLVRQFNVSKLVVREAIQALALRGLVHVQQGKRTIVLPETEWDVRSSLVQRAFRDAGRAAELTDQFYEARKIVEVSSARLAAERVSTQQAKELGDIVAEMRNAEDSRDLPAFLALDRKFHDAIAKAAGNKVLQQMTRSIHAFLTANWERSKVKSTELATLLTHHAEIADAIGAHNPSKAEESMLHHLEWAERVELEVARESPSLSEESLSDSLK